MAIKFGKKPARQDPRTIPLGAILNPTALPLLPDDYDFDDAHPDVPNPMYKNDEHPCCVIAGRAHHTLRFELTEQGGLPTITDDEVIDEWRRQSKGAEEGLYLMDSLKLWRDQGWKAGGKKYSIKAFAKVDPADVERMKTAIYLLGGVGLGLVLPFAVTRDSSDAAPWSVPEDPSLAEKDPHGGHYLLLTGYDASGPVGVTWGRKQSMTWDFVRRYADEAFAMVDSVDTWLVPNSPINVKALIDYLTVVGSLVT